ncbi:hypothetical protein DERF_004823 [Dermatophagoides farinae]|uniref:Uncharacterized protein n=1 Tax=Dermatophagoides farinae TaxID=6954 RepID=A0A922I296_DERFA|nr:hypothetical protein DERF_004823 [Dermatophagoides farinae]
MAQFDLECVLRKKTKKFDPRLKCNGFIISSVNLPGRISSINADIDNIDDMRLFNFIMPL